MTFIHQFQHTTQHTAPKPAILTRSCSTIRQRLARITASQRIEQMAEAEEHLPQVGHSTQLLLRAG